MFKNIDVSVLDLHKRARCAKVTASAEQIARRVYGAGGKGHRSEKAK